MKSRTPGVFGKVLALTLKQGGVGLALSRGIVISGEYSYCPCDVLHGKLSSEVEKARWLFLDADEEPKHLLQHWS